MQKDLISRQMAVETIMGQPPEPHYPSWYAAQIEGLPPAQPEIIRCKDCKYWRIDSEGERYCDRIVGVLGCDAGNGFCSDAERR